MNTVLSRIIWSMLLVIVTCIHAQGSESVDTRTIDELILILNEGKHSTGLYEQIARLYYEQDDIASSRLYYEKALLLEPRNTNVIQAIDYLKEELEVPITDIPDFILSRWYKQIASMLSPNLWTVVQLLALSGLVGFLYSELILKKRPVVRWRLGFLVGLIGLTCFGGLMAFQAKKLSKGGNAGIIIEARQLLSAPDTRSEVIADIGPGNKVIILDKIDDWVKVELADKDIGWLPLDQLAVI